jgi:diaminopimelate decarboxylase
MSNFRYQNNQLYAEGVPLATIAEQFGTPCYVYSRATLEQNFLAYQNAQNSHEHMICYAVKANSNIAVLNVLAQLGSGFDIVSGGELERVLAAGGDPGKTVFSGVGKSTDEMKKALEIGIHCFNIESELELKRLNETALAMGKIAPISLRVNPDVDAKTHPYISTGLKDNKFGVDIDDAPAIYQLAQSMPGIQVRGVGCHIGSQLTELEPLLDALDRVLVLVDTLQDQNIQLQHLDLGGGLGVRYKDEVPPSISDLISAVTARLADRKLTLILEPGRSICADAGILLTKVEYLKCNEHKNFAIIDAAMNDLIRPSLYQAWMDIIPVTNKDDGNPLEYDVVGPICESTDFMGKQRLLSIDPGDLLAICSAGAYSFTMSSNYNTRNRAAEIMIDKNSSHLVRRRESYQDQLALESILTSDAGE